jgi:hypothetical protein
MKHKSISVLVFLSIIVSIIRVFGGIISSIVAMLSLSALLCVLSFALAGLLMLIPRIFSGDVAIGLLFGSGSLTGEFWVDVFRTFTSIRPVGMLALLFSVSAIVFAVDSVIANMRYGLRRILTLIGAFLLVYVFSTHSSFLTESFSYSSNVTMSVVTAIIMWVLILLSILLLFRIGTDFLFIMIGFIVDRDFRRLIFRSIHYNKIKVAHPEVGTSVSKISKFTSIFYSLGPFAWSLFVSVLMGAIAVIAMYHLVNWRSNAIHVEEIPYLGRITKFIYSESFSDQNLASVMILMIFATLSAGLIISIICYIRKLYYSFIYEWVAVAFFYICFFPTFVDIADTSFGRYTGASIVGFAISFPLLMIILTQRGLVWSGLNRSLDLFRSAVQRAPSEVPLSTSRPAMYLRAFSDDTFQFAGRTSVLDFALGRPRRRIFLEHLIAQHIMNWRPLVAFSNRFLALQTRGSYKYEISNERWKSEIEKWNNHCPYIVMVTNYTESLSFEVSLLRRTNKLNETIFFIPASSRINTFFSGYGIIEQSSVPKNTRVVYYNSSGDWVAITSFAGTYSAYAIALEIAISEIEMRVRRPIQEQE